MTYFVLSGDDMHAESYNTEDAALKRVIELKSLYPEDYICVIKGEKLEIVASYAFKGKEQC
jgi:hypothetical protein